MTRPYKRRQARVFESKEWSAVMIARFCAAWNEGVTAQGLGERFGIPTQSVSQLVSKFRREGRGIVRWARKRKPK